MKNSVHSKNLEAEGFKRICSAAELTEGKGKRFIINDIDIAVFKINSKIVALSNVCPHQLTPLIYDGLIEDSFIVCPAHGWKFNLFTGNKDSGHKGLDMYAVKIVQDDVYAKITPKKFGW